MNRGDTDRAWKNRKKDKEDQSAEHYRHLRIQQKNMGKMRKAMRLALQPITLVKAEYFVACCTSIMFYKEETEGARVNDL